MAFLDKLKKLVQQAPAPAVVPTGEELNALLNKAIQMATRLIEAHGSHVPFCMAISTEGERVNVAVDDSNLSHADVLLESLRKHIADAVRNKKYRALVLARNVTYRSGANAKEVEAIQLTLDHLKDCPSTYYLPYRLVDGRVVLDELFATEPVEQFFLSKASFVAGQDGVVSSSSDSLPPDSTKSE